MSSGLLSPQKLVHSKERFFILLCLIMGLLILVPILNRFTPARIFLDLFLTAIVISMVYSVGHKKRYVLVGLLLAIVMLASMWFQYFHRNNAVAAIGMVAGAFIIVMVLANLLGFMFKSKEVTREVIFAAILLYVLSALMWAFFYTFLELVDPASFNIDLGQPEGYLLVFQYYSFVTITTLGYGDVTPVTEVAKAFAVLEAVVGQLYLVVVVAWLVGMHVSRKAS